MINYKIDFYNETEGKYEDYTENAIFPLKTANLLDEQLDECSVTLKQAITPFFRPLTLVRITIINKPEALFTQADFEEFTAKKENDCTIEYNSQTKQITETKTVLMVVASDNAIEVPIGSELYNHDIYLIELTKIMEGYIGDSITFTNALGNDFLTDSIIGALFQIGTNENSRLYSSEKIKTPNLSGDYTFPSMEEFVSEANTKLNTNYTLTTGNGQEILIKDSDGNEYASQKAETDISGLKLIVTTTIDGNTETSELSRDDYLPGFTAYIEGGKYDIIYKFSAGQTISGVGSIAFVENHYPLKKWTIKTVLERIFDTVTPILDDEKPKFRLAEHLKEKFDKIIAPEFAFTKMTLREMLKQVGGFIHAEPRISKVIWETGGARYFEVDFDFYGETTKSNIANEDYITATLGVDINEHCTSLDSSVDNLVSQLDWAQGVIIEPFYNGAKSLRCETTTVRMGEDNNTFIATEYPIYQILSVKYKYTTTNGTTEETNYADITPYIFESSSYANLSSYDGAYPYTKAYALEYTQGQKNIRGLFFKTPHAVSDIFRNYSIVNILEDKGLKPSKNYKDYMQMSFQVEYLPIYSARVKTNKQIVVDGMQRTLACNQSANIIESRYYGENLKGTVARLGNVEKTYTYMLPFIHQIPKAGTKFDKNYYISAVSCEYLPDCIKCTVALSKDFNRLSQYIGISSNKRMWEVSEKQSFERESLISEYVLITTDEKKTSDDYRPTIGITKNTLARLLLTSLSSLVSAVKVKRYSKRPASKKELLPSEIVLPVMSTALGNSLLFTYRFEDNYSAGQKVVSAVGDNKITDNNVTGYWGAYVPYCDYYGRFYYLQMQFLRGELKNDGDNGELELPEKGVKDGSGLESEYFVYRKDSREVPSITVELGICTDKEDIIIGSALASNCGLINRSPIELKYYLLDKEINNLDSRIDLTNATEITNLITFNNDNIRIKAQNVEHVAWAIVTEQTTEKIQVEDEDGKQTTQSIIKGGELVLGQNAKAQGQTLHFVFKRNLYK